MRFPTLPLLAMQTAVVLSWTLVACAASGAAPSAGGEGGENGAGGVDPPDFVHVVGSAPSSAQVTLDAATKQGLADSLASDSLDVVRLRLFRMHPKSAKALRGVKIFLDKPDADADTPVDDPHYVGALVLGLEDVQSSQWNAAPTLRRILGGDDLAARDSLTVTFVPDVWDWADGLPEDFAIGIEQLSLSLPDGR